MSNITGKVLVISPNGKNIVTSISSLNISDSLTALHSMYKILSCKLVDYRACEIAGLHVELWFDAKILANNKRQAPRLLLSDGTRIYGNFLIARSDISGRTIGLTDREIQILFKWIHQHLN